MVDQHLSDDALQEFLDGRLDAGERERIVAHLHTCDHCTEELQSLRSVDITLRRIPLMQPGSRFTATVMQGILGSSSAAFRLLEYTAYFFGLLIVGAISALVFFILGNGDQSAGADGGMRAAAGSLSTATESMLASINKLTVQVMTAPSLRIAFMIALSVGFLVILDRLLWRRMGHRS